MDLLIHDSCDVIAVNKVTGQTFITAEAQLNTISQTLGIDEGVFGGIGVRQLARIRGQKEITTQLRNALYNAEILAATQGVEVKEDTAVIDKLKEGLTVGENGAIELGEEVADGENEVTVRHGDGRLVKAEIENGEITVDDEFAKEGDVVSVAYKQEVTGRTVNLDSEKFSEAHKITYHTIAYNRNNEVVKDIYIELFHAVPGGDFEMALEMGEPIAPEIEFDILVEPGSSLMGRIIEVDRVDGEQQTPPGP